MELVEESVHPLQYVKNHPWLCTEGRFHQPLLIDVSNAQLVLRFHTETRHPQPQPRCQGVEGAEATSPTGGWGVLCHGYCFCLLHYTPPLPVPVTCKIFCFKSSEQCEILMIFNMVSGGNLSIGLLICYSRKVWTWFVKLLWTKYSSNATFKKCAYIMGETLCCQCSCLDD